MHVSPRSNTRLVFLLLLAAGLGGCGGGPLDPADAGGVRLEGTSGTDARGGQPFSLSADGRWLSFALEVPLPADAGDDEAALAAYELKRLAGFRLLGLGHVALVRPEISAEAASHVRAGGYPLPGAGCWAEGRFFLRTTGRQTLYLDPAETPLAWRLADADPGPARCPFPERGGLLPGVHGPVLLIDRGDGSLELQTASGGRRLALHEPAWLPGMGIQLSYLSASPDGARVAYGVTDHFGSFVGNTTVYVLDLDGGAGPRALGAPVSYVQWSPDGRDLYGYVKRPQTGGSDYAIYRWRPAG
ncbi:MAG: hypothetical protein R3174_10175 [Gammaproteobacteria bacterium]|nr:hypothetical protein [Gammaproteobacteria bacterium]